ncbi:hypothetical protein SLEP1_g41834 [Rubroshorea leprosula]|uniref:Uncharacterized protein n=1 Tax=Rubroshorea leprosula TaxID=152421 RepID=A0AAV5L7S8_9ROSI|nr:hypothetical protein SLEP1_g41834 [Rubroshorea leprosula]
MFADLAEDNSILTTGDEFAWFGEMEPTLSTVLESPLFTETSAEDSADCITSLQHARQQVTAEAVLAEIPWQLELETPCQKFEENVLDATKKFEKLITDKKEPGGLPATAFGLAHRLQSLRGMKM